jgi:hypothetical protein
VLHGLSACGLWRKNASDSKIVQLLPVRNAARVQSDHLLKLGDRHPDVTPPLVKRAEKCMSRCIVGVYRQRAPTSKDSVIEATGFTMPIRAVDQLANLQVLIRTERL